MATKTVTTKNRRLLSRLDQQYPESTKSFTIASSRGGFAAEAASIRQMRDNGLVGSDGAELANFPGFSWMQECNRSRILNSLAMAHPGHYDWRNCPEDRAELASLLQKAELSDEWTKEMAQYRQFVVTSDLLAMPFALGAFQSINLSADELPQIITPKARQYFTVRYQGQDGGSRQAQWRTARSAAEIEMRLFATDKVEYPIIDLQQGDVNEFDKVNAQLRYDMEMKIDQTARVNLDAGVVLSGLKSLLNIHPLIDQSNIPDTNYLDLTDVGTYGTAQTLTIARLKAILGQLAQWGFGLDPDGPVTIKTMIMSPQNARDSWDYVDLIANWNAPAGSETVPKNTISTPQRDAIYNSGSLINSAWGYNWESQFNTRISKGTLYVLTNLPVGWYFTKTNFDRMIEWKDTPDAIEQNIGQVMWRKAAQFYMPQMWGYRFLKVVF